MLQYLLLGSIVLGLCFAVVGQEPSVSDPSWRTETIDNLGFKSIDVPARLVREPDSTMEVKQDNASGTRYGISWAIWSKGETVLPTLRGTVYATMWSVDFPEAMNLKGATCEGLVRADVAKYERLKADGLNGVVDARYLELDGVPGLLYRREFEITNGGTRERRANVVWKTYRYYEKKPQSIMLIITGHATELETLMRIVNSLKFRKPGSISSDH